MIRTQIRALFLSSQVHRSMVHRVSSLRWASSRFPRQGNYVPQQRKRLNWTKIMLSVLCGGAVATGIAWWTLWPHHTFTSGVAKVLRKALWAESDRGGHDYQQALAHYIEALELAQREELDPLSDEYTGVQLKIGEMYEKLGMAHDALMVYSEISSAYLLALTTPSTVVGKDRPHLVQKDLRVVLKCCQLNSKDPVLCKLMLMTHLLVAQEEVSKRSAHSAKLIAAENTEQLIGDLHSSKTDSSQGLQLNREAWEPFRDELFNARDLYCALCIVTGDLMTAARTATATTAWMINAECSPTDIMKSQTNLGSVLFLNAEACADKLEQAKTSGSMSPEDMESLEKIFSTSIDSATMCYNSVLEFSKKLPTTMRRSEGMEENIALATYGLGVVSLQQKDLSRARGLLREARVRAKGAGFDDLVGNAENELKKVRQYMEADLAAQTSEKTPEQPSQKLLEQLQQAKGTAN